MTVRILIGDCRERLRELPDGSVHCVVTSPPYFGLRDYGTAAWEGGDPACDHRPSALKADRAEQRPKLGDSYATNSSQLIAFGKRISCDKCGASKTDKQIGLEPNPQDFVAGLDEIGRGQGRNKRSVWTVSTISFDLEHCSACWTTYKSADYRALRTENIVDGDGELVERRIHCSCGRHDSWLSHFAAFPPDLITDCVKAGCPVGGTVLDPFFGAGTTGLVADRLGRNAIGIELNPHYAAMAEYRLKGDGGMFTDVASEAA